jgi:Flp pilus assembly protein TadB|tara:strand:+ start:288 stop:578 length:291 start_codon:yes stop_codon:yes gene_type:complete
MTLAIVIGSMALLSFYTWWVDRNARARVEKVYLEKLSQEQADYQKQIAQYIEYTQKLEGRHTKLREAIKNEFGKSSPSVHNVVRIFDEARKDPDAT